MITLDGKRILVTGAAAGMGRAIAELAAGAGARVLATDRNAEALTTLDVDGVETATLDVTDKAAIEALFDVEPPFDGLVNTAGWVFHGTLTETGDEDWARSFQINVDSIFHTIRAALPGMIGAGGGTIVNMASIASSMKGFHFRAAYAASKAAVIGLTKSVAVDYMDDGIRCHAVCPGTIRSPSLIQRIEALAETMGGYEEAEAYFAGRQPMGRLGEPDEIGKFVCFLLSDAATFATGQAYVIDGGILA